MTHTVLDFEAAGREAAKTSTFPQYDGAEIARARDTLLEAQARAAVNSLDAQLREALGPVRGQWVCDKCQFVQVKRILNPITGACGSPSVAELPICPNDNEPMRSRTWRDLCIATQGTADRWLEERDRLLKVLREALDFIDGADAPSIGGTPMTSHVASAYVALASIIDRGRDALGIKG